MNHRIFLTAFIVLIASAHFSCQGTDFYTLSDAELDPRSMIVPTFPTPPAAHIDAILSGVEEGVPLNTESEQSHTVLPNGDIAYVIAWQSPQSAQREINFKLYRQGNLQTNDSVNVPLSRTTTRPRILLGPDQTLYVYELFGNYIVQFTINGTYLSTTILPTTVPRPRLDLKISGLSVYAVTNIQNTNEENAQEYGIYDTAGNLIWSSINLDFENLMNLPAPEQFYIDNILRTVSGNIVINGRISILTEGIRSNLRHAIVTINPQNQLQWFLFLADKFAQIVQSRTPELLYVVTNENLYRIDSVGQILWSTAWPATQFDTTNLGGKASFITRSDSLILWRAHNGLAENTDRYHQLIRVSATGTIELNVTYDLSKLLYVSPHWQKTRWHRSLNYPQQLSTLDIALNEPYADDDQLIFTRQLEHTYTPLPDPTKVDIHKYLYWLLLRPEVIVNGYCTKLIRIDNTGSVAIETIPHKSLAIAGIDNLHRVHLSGVTYQDWAPETGYLRMALDNIVVF